MAWQRANDRIPTRRSKVGSFESAHSVRVSHLDYEMARIFEETFLIWSNHSEFGLFSQKNQSKEVCTTKFPDGAQFPAAGSPTEAVNLSCYYNPWRNQKVEPHPNPILIS